MDAKKFLFIVVLMGLSLSCRGKSKVVRENQKEKVVPVQVTTPFRGTIEKRITLTGVIMAEPLTPVLPDVPGKFLRYTVSEGQYVKKGQTIALLDRKMPGMEYREYPVEAPTSGRVHLLNVSRGQMVSPQTPIAQIYGKPYVKLMVPGIYSGKITRRQKVKVENREGIVYYVSSIADPRSSAFEVRAWINGPIGKTVDVSIVVSRSENALLIPTSAVVGVETRSVFVVKDGIAHRRVVKIGISNEDYTEILEGLSESDTVAVLGARNLIDGMKVRVVK